MLNRLLVALSTATALILPVEGSAQLDRLDSAFMLTMECNDAAMGGASVEAGICINYLDGVLDGANMGGPFAVFCPANGTSLGQLAGQFTQFMRSHTELLVEHRATAVWNMMKSTFPCPKKLRIKPSSNVDATRTAYALMVNCDVTNRNPTTCMHYLIGVVDGANAEEKRFCPPAPPANSSVDRLPYIYQMYAQAHPEMLSKDQMDVIPLALWEAFPCRKVSPNTQPNTAAQATARQPLEIVDEALKSRCDAKAREAATAADSYYKARPGSKQLSALELNGLHDKVFNHCIGTNNN